MADHPPIYHLLGDATCPIGTGNRIIVHVCNDRGKWGRGFVMELSRKWPVTRRQYMSLDKYTLGQVQFVQVEDTIMVANLIAQRGVGKPDRCRLDYEGLGRGLLEVDRVAREWRAGVHMPKIGAGLAGGDWNKILDIISSSISSPVWVYSLHESEL